MSFSKYLNNQIGKFYYFIIMPKEDMVIFYRQTFFNKFSTNIINSSRALNFISYLPATYDEYFNEWPLNINNYDVDSKSEIIYIFDYDIDEKCLDDFSKIKLGCIFLLDDINSNIAQKIINRSNIPVVSENVTTSKEIPMTISGINQVYKKWNNNVNNFIRLVNKKNNKKIKYRKIEFNKSKLKGIKSPSTMFLDPLNVIINKLRGLQKDIYSNSYNIEPAHGGNLLYKEKEADDLLIYTVKILICEKFLLLNLGYIKEGSFDEEDSINLSQFNIDKSILEEIIKRQEMDLYDYVCNNIFNNFDKLNFGTDMVLCLPSVNYIEVSEYNNLLQKYKYSDELIEIICNESLYYGELHKVKHLEQELELIQKRAVEKNILTLMYVLYALPMKIPYIRTRNIPSILLYRNIFIEIEKSYIKYDIAKMNNEIRKVSDILKKSCSYELWKIINNHSKYIKILSDMPIEWIKIDKVPLCIEKRIGRIPITPGNGLVSNSYFSRKYQINKSNLKIMIVNTLTNENKNINLNCLAEKLNIIVNEHLSDIKKECIYRKINTKCEFIENILLEKPTILIYYGHGVYNTGNNVGSLYIGNEEITSIELENINPKPLITILGACETNVNYGTHLNIGNLLIGSGCVSVIGTHLRIRGNHAVSFISELIRNLVMCFTNKGNSSIYSWDEVIFRTYQSHYILDAIITLEDYTKQNLDYLKSKYIEYCKEKNIDKRNIFKLRDDILLEVLKQDNFLYGIYLKLLESDSIVPLSILYVSLGSPEKILIVTK